MGVPQSVRKSAPLGRPPSEAAVSHSAIMDAVYELLQEKSARELTMEAIARRAKVGKPTLYKWWPSKDALIMAMFHERLAGHFEAPAASTAEEAIRTKMRRLIAQLNGVFGKVMADLIAEGQSDSESCRNSTSGTSVCGGHLRSRILSEANWQASSRRTRMPSFWSMQFSHPCTTASCFASHP